MYSVRQYSVQCIFTIQCNTVQYRINTVYCSKHIIGFHTTPILCSTLLCCTILHYAAIYYSVICCRKLHCTPEFPNFIFKIWGIIKKRVIFFSDGFLGCSRFVNYLWQKQKLRYKYYPQYEY